MCQFRHELTFSFSLWSLPETFHFGTIVTKLILPPKNPFFTKKERTCVNFCHKWTFLSLAEKGRMRVRFANNPIPDTDIRYVFVIK